MKVYRKGPGSVNTIKLEWPDASKIKDDGQFGP